MKRIAFVVLLLAAAPAHADETAVGHVEAWVVDPSIVVTLPDCTAGMDQPCIEVVTVPECPAGQPALDCIPVE